VPEGLRRPFRPRVTGACPADPGFHPGLGSGGPSGRQRSAVIARATRLLGALDAPSNKGGSGRADDLARRDALIDQPVNLVEVDLLLSGSRMPVSGKLKPGEYVAVVARAERRPQADVYAWPMRQPLPVLPIPLRAPDPDISLDLGEAFRMTYDRGGYARVMRYGRPLPEGLPVSAEDRKWAEGFGK
jgi:hypothetical protein